MFRKIMLVCAGLAALELGLIARTAPAGRADFSYVNPSGIHTLDPARMSWTQDFRVALNLWEGLTTWHPQTVEPIEGAAVFPPAISEDRLTYTFTIRDDARWSNGDVVTAGDFVRGWRRAIEPGTAADYAFLLTDHIAGAAHYVGWRQEAVGLLPALDRLRRGGVIDAEQSRTLAQHGFLESPSMEHGTARESADVQEPSYRPDVNWKAAYEQAWTTHAAELQSRFGAVGIEARDDRTLVVRLAKPCPYFLDLLGLPAFLPCHSSIELLREGSDGGPISEHGLVNYDPQWTKPDYHRSRYPGLITNGAYRLAEWTFKRRLRMEVNPFHREAPRVACRTIDMLEYENVSASILAYEAGQVDFLTDLSVPYDHELFRLARSGERRDFRTCVLLATYFLNFNCVSAEVAGRPNPFVDPRVRKAFTLALDREQIVEKVRRRGDRVAWSFVPGGALPGYEPPEGLRRDAATARRLLAEAGFSEKGSLGPVELLFVANDERVCQAMARMWEETLGVRVELRSQESKTFAEEKANHRFMMARGNWYADYNDPTTFLDTLLTGNGNNDSGYSSPHYDDLMRRANESVDARERSRFLREAEAIVVERDCPILPVLHYTETIAVQPYVRGLHPNPRMWFPFRYATIER